ncbi:MAG: DDE-type integrase/transposase/recombinase [Clostridiales bacterium]|nr:DDE-type integrase/transposase/recombinase [Clostridiales bacterium]
MDNDLKQKIALFRYSLIAPLLTNTFSQNTAKEYLQEVTAKTFDVPGRLSKTYSPSTIKDWLRLYRKFGIDVLYPKSRSDKGSSRSLPKDAKDFIIACKMEMPKRSAKSIYHELIANGYISYDEVSLCTVQRFIKKANITPQKLEPQDRRAFEFEFPNDCWQSDISVGPYLTIGNKKYKTYIIAFLDDASRLILHCKAFFSDNFISLLTAFKKAVAKRGIPKKLFVDNARVYQSEQMQLICASLGTILCFARLYSPESKGKIERWFRTLHDQWMNTTDWLTFESLDNLNARLARYAEQYNNTIHSSIKQKPIDKYTRYIDKLRFIPSKQELNYTFLYRVTRTVKNDATISMNGILFEVPLKYVGDKISIRYDPTCLDKAFIFTEDGKLADTIYPVNKIENTKVLREQNVKPVDFSPFATT